MMGVRREDGMDDGWGMMDDGWMVDEGEEGGWLMYDGGR